MAEHPKHDIEKIADGVLEAANLVDFYAHCADGSWPTDQPVDAQKAGQLYAEAADLRRLSAGLLTLRDEVHPHRN